MHWCNYMYFPVVRSQVLTAASTCMTAFWDIAIFALMMEEVITSETSVCLYRSTGALSQKAVIFTFQLHCLEMFTSSWLTLKSMCCRFNLFQGLLHNRPTYVATQSEIISPWKM
jgi:hypothetical protein